MLHVLILSAHAGRFDARAPTDPGHGWAYVGAGRSTFSTEFWEQGGQDQTFELPASWTTWRVDVLAEVAAHPHLAVSARVPLVYADGHVQSERLCSTYGMCDDVLAFGDLGVGVRSPWQLGPVLVTGRFEVATGVGYRHAIDDLGAPGDGNTDLIPGVMVAWSGQLGPLRMGASGGVETEIALGRPPNALQEGGEVWLGWRWFEVGGELLRYDSLGGLSFNQAVVPDRMTNDPERFTDISNDYTSAAARLSVTPTDRVSVHGGVWRAFAVRNGPGDNGGATVGVSTWW
jgi:hypothetical protein